MLFIMQELENYSDVSEAFQEKSLPREKAFKKKMLLSEIPRKLSQLFML